jgi:hypothetical protein
MFYKNILLQTINDNINSKNNYIISEGVKEMKQKYLKQGIDSNIIDSYLERYKNIKASKYLKDEIQINVQPNDRNNIDKFNDFHDLEVLVDYVENKINLDKQDKTLKKSYRSDNEIETDGKPVYQDSELQILYADSPRACIKYKGDFPYSWCISADTGQNMYTSYRFKEYEPAFYFVKQLKKIDKELNENPDFPTEMLDKYHFFVIQVFKNVKMGDWNSKYYYVTSALNDGDIQMSWNEIVKKAQILSGKQEIFKAVPHSEGEKSDYQRFKNGIGDEEFKVLSVEEKRKYLDIYVSQEKLLSDEQFLSMPKSLQKLYIGFGVPISEEQFEYVKNNSELLKYYSIVLKRRIEKSDEGMNVEFSNEEVLYVYGNQLGSEEFNKKYYNIIYYNTKATEEEQIDFVRNYHKSWNIQYIKNPSEKVQLKAVSGDGNVIRVIVRKGISPSEEVQLKAVTTNVDSIRYIPIVRNNKGKVIQPSLNVQMSAVKKDGSIIEYLVNANINPIEKVQLEVIKSHPFNIKHIKNPTEKVQLKAVTRDGFVISYIPNIKDDKGNIIQPSEIVQFSAIENTVGAIHDIKNPTEIVQLYFLYKSYHILQERSVGREKYALEYLIKTYTDLKSKRVTTPKVDKVYRYMVKNFHNKHL